MSVPRNDAAQVGPAWTPFELATGHLALSVPELVKALTDGEAGKDGYRTVGNRVWITRAGMRRLEDRYLVTGNPMAGHHKPSERRTLDDRPSPDARIDQLALLDACTAAAEAHTLAKDEAAARRMVLGASILAALDAGARQRDVAEACGCTVETVRSLAGLVDRTTSRSRDLVARDLDVWLRPGQIEKVHSAVAKRQAARRNTARTRGDTDRPVEGEL